jgi:lichenan operon transcriptional antiterminator
MFLDKEQVSSMIYDNGVAFPHLTDKTTKKLNLTLGFLMPSTGKLKLIFFLLIPEELDQKDEDKLMKLYDQIFSIIGDAQLVGKILSTGRDDTQSGYGLKGE